VPLEQIGARIIIAAFLFGFVAFRITGAHSQTWFGKFWALIMFGMLAVGATIGVAGMISNAIQHRKKKLHR
jgi:hypothetical protein